MFLEELYSLRGKTAVVIGGSGALGGEIASGFARAGANIVVVGRSEVKIGTRVAALCAEGHNAIGCKTDVSKKQELQRVLDLTLKHFGAIDILVNAAGVNSSTPFFEIEESEWDRILDINLRGIFLASQIFGKTMSESGRGGSIINISSVSSEPPLSRVFVYSVAKGDVNQITKYLAREFAVCGVRVNAIVPGFFPAEQNRSILKEDRITSILNHTPMRRLGEPFELIGAAIFLASERASSFVTGTTLRVDGGFGGMTI